MYTNKRSIHSMDRHPLSTMSPLKRYRFFSEGRPEKVVIRWKDKYLLPQCNHYSNIDLKYWTQTDSECNENDVYQMSKNMKICVCVYRFVYKRLSIEYQLWKLMTLQIFYNLYLCLAYFSVIGMNRELERIYFVR